MTEKRDVTARGLSIEEKLALWAPSIGPDLRKDLWEAHHEIVRLRGVEEAAGELVDQPFGQLNERSFYRLREALDV